MNRKDFIQYSLALAGISATVTSCFNKKKIKGSIIGASSSTGHLLRDQQFSQPTSTERKKIVIAGAGVSGLSAARYLIENGQSDIVLLELEQEVGGNARNGRNEISSFPFGAHYVPVPNNDLTEYINFLQQCGVVERFNEKGLPVYKDAYLCFEPEERLYINGRWQDGLIPNFGVPEKDQQQIHRFLNKMHELRYAKGLDGKDAFAIPVNQSSTDELYRKLDELTMKEWLLTQGFTSSYLHWYVNYCTRDDFGTPYELCSAWAGIHYFAGRKGVGANAGYSDVLTWPEGNGFLIKQLSKSLSGITRSQTLVVSVKEKDDKISVVYLDTKTKNVKEIIADQCILATPQFVTARLLQDPERIKRVKEGVHYAPWMVANLLVNTVTERSGSTFSWDNVFYESDSLGYVDATHQLLQQYIPKRNLTYYLPLTKQDPVEERKAAMNITHEEWTKRIISDLKKVHPDIEEALEEVNVMIWGHAMAQPRPGIIHGEIRKQLEASLNNKIHFAHTDLAGISIFEEGFYQGLEAAKKVIQHVG